MKAIVSALLVSGLLTGAAFAQIEPPLHVGTTNGIIDEFNSTLKGTDPAVIAFGFSYVTGEVVQILQADSGIFPPNSDGTPSVNNPVLYETRIGNAVDPTWGPAGMFGASVPDRPSGQVFARVFNKQSLSDSSFYANSQVFAVNPSFNDAFIPEMEKTSQPLDSSDPDGDDLINSWEESLGSDDGNPDSDGDGMLDGGEFAAGTGLTNGNSLLIMVQIKRPVGPNLDVLWDSVPGREYWIQHTPNLLDGAAYSNVTPLVTGTGAVTSTTIPSGADLANGHFRVKLKIPATLP